MPLPFEHIDKKEFDAAVADAHGGGGPFVDVFAMQEIILQFLLADQIRSLVVKFGKHPYGSGVAMLGALTHPGKLQGSHGLLVIVFHHSILLSCKGFYWMGVQLRMV